MKIAKNLNRWAYIAGLAMLLCCVASAGPTYSFVKIAGEWAFYEESDGFSTNAEVSQTGSGAARALADKESTFTDEDSNISLPAVGSVINLASDDNSSQKGTYLLMAGSSSNANGSSAKNMLLGDFSIDQVSVPSDAYPGASPYLVQTTLSNGGFKNPDLKNSNGKLQNNGNSNIPNGNAWGYWKNHTQDIAPVPVPVPGSIILAAIGAGLVKLLHDRRVRRA